LKHIGNKKRLFISVCGIFLLGLILSTLIAYFHVTKWITTSVKDEQLTLASVVQATTEQWFSASKESIHAFADKTASYKNKIENNELLDILIAQYTESKQFDYVSISLEVNGYYRTNQWQAPSDYDPRIRPWYKAAKMNEKIAISGPYRAFGDPSTYYLSVSAPIFGNRKFLGVVSGDIKLTTFESLFVNHVEAESLTRIVSRFIIDNEGTIITHHEKSIIGKKLTTIGHLNPNLNDRLPSLALKGNVFVSEKSMYAIVPLSSLNLNLVVEFSKKELNQKLLTEMLLLLSHFLIVFILVVVALYIANRNVVKPLFKFLEFDNETELPNKKHFKQSVTSQYLKTDTQGLLLIINLDYFNALTSSYSTVIIRQLLNQVKDRLQKTIGSQSLLGVFSESRFVSFIPNSKLGKHGNHYVLNQIIENLDKPFYIANKEINLAAHVGASTFPEHGDNIEELINHAFTAFGVSRKHGGADFCLYSEDMKAGAGKTHLLLSALRNGLRKKELYMVYQPQIDTKTNTMVSVEALVRWYSKELERQISPIEFIPIAETSELVGLLGDYIIEQVFIQISTWREKGIYIPKVAINISPNHLMHKNFCTNLLQLVEKNKIDIQQIELEITETSLIDSPQAALEVLKQLKSLGFSLAIDDFGSGYSSFQYLKEMPINKLKIDRMFVQELEYNSSDQAIIQSLVAIAKNMGFSLLAEGVENKAQLDILSEKGVFITQGYYFSKPINAEDIANQISLTGMSSYTRLTGKHKILAMS
jgi:EAL domain-containing protein (putative c-di-GMP-specific phosphodiesterase class I)/GGDEF domain-containing protein